MKVREQPIGLRDYYKSMQEHYTKQMENAQKELDKAKNDANVLHDEIKEKYKLYNKNYKIDIFKYQEFIKNKYIDGKLLRFAKSAYLNRKEEYRLTMELFHFLRYAKLLEKIHNLETNIEFYTKILSIKCYEYTGILRDFFKEVHKHLILKGEGYAFGENIGWICINRCHVKRRFHQILDYKATRDRKKQLLAEGKRIFNKEEADWCEKNGIEYKAEDIRVYRDKEEYVYEVPLIDSHLPHGDDLKMELINYRSSRTKVMNYEQLINECNRDTTKICELDIDLRTKIVLCNEVDKLLYTNFIRNEYQTSINASKATREGGQ